MYSFPLGLLLLGLALVLIVLLVRLVTTHQKYSDEIMVLGTIFSGLAVIVLLVLSQQLVYSTGYHDAIQDIQEKGRTVITDTLYVANP